jgi:hypothetical protein
VAGRIGHDEHSSISREVTVGDIDGDALVALGLETVEKQREIDVTILRSHASRVGLERCELIFEQQLRLIQEPSDQRALPVIDAAARDETQQASTTEVLQVTVYAYVFGRADRGHQK